MKSRLGLVLAAAVLMACSAQQSTPDAAYFVANPDKIDAVMSGCRSGATAAEVCQQASLAQQQLAREKRMEAYSNTIADRPAAPAPNAR